MTQISQTIIGILVVVCLALGGAVAWYGWTAEKYKAEAAFAIADRDRAVDANKDAENTISALQEQSRLDSRLTASMVEEMRKISDGLAEQSQQIDELEKSNADVRAYLDTVVPADLRKLRQR